MSESPLRHGLMGRCPRCGKGHLFSGFLTVAESCPECGLSLIGHDSGDGPAVAGTFVLGTFVGVAAVVVDLTLEPPLWVHVALWLPITVFGTLGMLRPLKGLNIAIQYRWRSVEEPEKLGGQ